MEDDFIWVFAWRPWKIKWLLFILENFNEIKKINKNFKLLILLLEKNNKKKINEILKYAKLYSKSIKIIYEIEHKYIYNYLNIADVGIVPSYSEWFGCTSLEFSILWKTIIASNIWWIPEINFKNIHFFCHWNVQEFIYCFKKVFNWKKNNYWYNKKLSVEKMTEQYLAIYLK